MPSTTRSSLARRLHRPVPRVALPTLVAALAACSEGTAPVVPATVTAVTAVTTAGIAGEPIAVAPAVLVADERGGPMHGVSVTFTVAAGAGRLATATPGGATSAAVLTGADGIATAPAWRLGTTVGENVLTAAVARLAPVRFTAATTAGAAARLVAVSGDAQRDTTRAVLAQPITVRVTDVHGNAVAGAPVSFVALAGTTTPGHVTSDAQGLASAAWHLPEVAGTAVLQARLAEVATAAPLVATATAEWPHVVARRLAVAYNSACALSERGETFCWGENSDGQLGHDTAQVSSIGVRVADAPEFVELTAGAGHVCGLTAAGLAVCWGRNVWGQLGDGSRTSRAAPAPAAAALRFTALRAGAEYTCGLTADGAVHCWGFMLGATVADGPLQVSSAVRFHTLGTKAELLCGVAEDDDTYCFLAGEQPDGRWRWTPQNMRFAERFVSLTGGLQHQCGLVADGRAMCWGSGTYGQLGAGEATPGSVVPVEVAGGHAFAAVFGAYDWSCGTTTAGALLCWGHNSWGVLGAQAPTPPHQRFTPVMVSMPAGVTPTTVEGGFMHACGATADGAAYCWGLGNGGQLGDGTSGGFHATPTPQRVMRRW